MPASEKIANLEALLRARRLDRTLTTSRLAPPGLPVAPVGLPAIDLPLGGGLPRGHMSEIVGARSTGRTTVLHALLGAATARGEFVALVDTLDAFDPESAAGAGVDLDRLLWVRGPSLAHGTTGGRAAHDLIERACERALKAFNLILQASGSGAPFCAVLDLIDVPALVIRRIPFITWLRLQRAIEGRDGFGVLVADTSLGRSARGITLRLEASPIATEPSPRSPWQAPPFHMRPTVISARVS